jgi:hypothetical protein
MEAVISLSVFSFSMMTMLSMMNYVTSQQDRVRLLKIQDRQVLAIVANIRARLKMYRMTPIPADDITADPVAYQAALDAQKYSFPLAFSKTVMTTSENCPSCPGRISYIIQPYKLQPGLAKVTVWIKNPELLGTDGILERSFVANY